jgi:predicted HTH transcriptional regulator
MNLVKSIFGVDLQSIDYDVLTNFFVTQQEESSKIEFKSGEVEIESLYKEVCAFLNTDGGVLVLGAPKEKTLQLNKHTKKRICQGDLTPTNFRSSSWLHQKISSNISPSPFGTVIQEILTEAGNYFIFEIPKSINPPHQSLSDGTYYIRIDEQAETSTTWNC